MDKYGSYPRSTGDHVRTIIRWKTKMGAAIQRLILGSYTDREPRQSDMYRQKTTTPILSYGIQTRPQTHTQRQTQTDTGTTTETDRHPQNIVNQTLL